MYATILGYLFINQGHDPEDFNHKLEQAINLIAEFCQLNMDDDMESD